MAGALESAFIWAYLETTEERGVPEHVAAAIDDAPGHTKAELEEQPEADLGTTVSPTFYKHVADFHCVDREE